MIYLKLKVARAIHSLVGRYWYCKRLRLLCTLRPTLPRGGSSRPLLLFSSNHLRVAQRGHQRNASNHISQQRRQKKSLEVKAP
jgi:hypothetical protein